MSDILAELLADTTPDSLPRKMAEKAAELYRLSMGVVERFAFPHTSIHVAVWAKGKPSHTTRKIQGSELSWDGERGSWVLASVCVPDGPMSPWGRSWLMLGERPPLIKHQKQPMKDVYRVELFRWVLKNPGHLFRETLLNTWHYKRWKVACIWYQSEEGDMCCHCKERVPAGQDVFIDFVQSLYCSACTDKLYNMRALELERRKAGGKPIKKSSAFGQSLYERLDND